VSVSIQQAHYGYLYTRRCKFCGYTTEGASVVRPFFVICGQCGNASAVPPEAVTAVPPDVETPEAVAFAAAKERGQTRVGSAIEVAMNIVVGFSINWVANLLILPLYGFQVTGSQAFSMGLIFTVIAIVRGYVLRRVFNRIRSLHHE
jgi:hypothetical protein